MTIFKTGKLHFDKNKSLINTDQEPDYLREFAIPKAQELKIELIEISKLDNPADIKIEIAVDETKRRFIHLYKYRTQFIFQNNTFFLDTSKLKEFTINLSTPVFKIEVKCDKDFDMTVYYTTDQKQELSYFQDL